MKKIKNFPAIGKSRPKLGRLNKKYHGLIGLDIPNGWSLAVIDLNVIYSFDLHISKDIASAAVKIIYPMLSHKIQNNVNNLSNAYQKVYHQDESYLNNAVRQGYRHLRESKLVNHNRNHIYSITSLGKHIVKNSNTFKKNTRRRYCYQYNEIVQLINDKNLNSNFNLNSCIVNGSSYKIPRKSTIDHGEEHRTNNDSDPVQATRNKKHSGNIGEELMKKDLNDEFSSNKKYLIKYKSPHLNHKDPNDACGYDASLKNLSTGKVYYVDAKREIGSSFTFHMSPNEVSQLEIASLSKDKEYCIFFYSNKSSLPNIYKTGTKNNGLNDDNGLPKGLPHYSNVNRYKHVSRYPFQSDDYIISPTKRKY